MARYTTKKSDLSVEAYFSESAFELLNPENNLHKTVVNHLRDFCPIRGDDIRLSHDANPLSYANVTYALGAFDGIGRVSIDKAQVAFFSPHLVETERIIGLSLAFLNAVSELITDSTYANFVIQGTFHCILEGIDPIAHTCQYASPIREDFHPAIGNSVTYYFGQEGARLYSSVGIDMSNQFSDCVFARTTIGYDGAKIVLKELPEATIHHYNKLLTIVGLESDQ